MRPLTTKGSIEASAKFSFLGNNQRHTDESVTISMNDQELGNPLCNSIGEESDKGEEEIRKETLAEKEVKVIKKNFNKLQELNSDDKQTIDKLRKAQNQLKQQNQDQYKNYKTLQDEMKKLKSLYNIELNEKKLLKVELDKMKEGFNASERKSLQLQHYI